MSILYFEIAGRRYRADTAAARDLAIDLDFSGRQPNFFNAPAASATTFATGGFVGDTRAGGSCNVGVYQLNPHCNGTHTECVGHLVDDVALTDMVIPTMMPATLASINVPDAVAIGRRHLESALRPWSASGFHGALIIRTRPNPPDKRIRRHEPQSPPPYLDVSALRLIRKCGVRHLLVDLPSLDRMDDDALTAHRIFWGLPSGSRAGADAAHPDATVTELIYAPDDIADGYYLLNLQVPAFAADAAPSRPVILPVVDAA